MLDSHTLRDGATGGGREEEAQAHLITNNPIGATLLRHQHLAQHRLRHFLDILQVGRQVHSSLETILERAQPTAAGQNHSLDHGIALVERVDVDVLGLVDRRNDLPLEKGGREGRAYL